MAAIRRSRLVGPTLLGGLFLLLSQLSLPQARAGEPFVESFDGWEPALQVRVSGDKPAEVHRERSLTAGRQGRGELIRITSTEEKSGARLIYPLPRARVLDELTAEIWIQTAVPGWTVQLSIVTPRFVDPRTSQPLRFLVKGDTLRTPGKWAQLTCRTPDSEVQQRLVLLRAQYPGADDLGQLYVESLVLEGPATTGTTEIRVDDLRLSPIVPPDVSEQPVRPVESTAASPPRVEVRLDRLLVDGHPFFPRIVPYHGESPELLRELEVNVVWLPELSDTLLIRRLWDAGFWVTGTPPRPRGDQGAVLESGEAGLLPFDASVDPVMFWMLGTRLSGNEQPAVAHWTEQLEFADRRRGRPIAADVAHDERRYSRDLDLLGISRHPLQTSMRLTDYRLWLQERRSLARPGAFCWTWLQTEPAPSVSAGLRDARCVACLEPEQIRLQAYAAISAGFRGVGFWTSGSLAGTSPWEQERRASIRRLNLELKFLEPWLATCTGVESITCTAAETKVAADARNLPFGLDLPSQIERTAQLRTRKNDIRQRQRRDVDLAAYVLRTELGSLIIPLWLESASQFVPAHAATNNVTLVIPGPEQAAAVMEISPVQLRSLRSERVTSGLKVELPLLDELALVWMTSDLSLVDRLRQRIQASRDDYAGSVIQLSTLKMERVKQVRQELEAIAPAQPDAPQKLGLAKLRNTRAEAKLREGDTVSAVQLGGEVLQLLRLVQRDDWDAAVEHLASPVSSPYTLCFQTLPDHWRLVSAFGESRERDSRNLLPSGEFEDHDTLVAEGWQNVHRGPDTLHTSAALFPTGRKSRYALRLECQPKPGVMADPVVDEPPVTVTTPAVQVRAGQILHVQGWVKVTRSLTGSRDGFMIYDSILGRPASLRIYEADQWTRFELLRSVPQTGPVTMTMCLTGQGEVLVDDLQMVPHDPRVSLANDSEASGVIPAGGSSLLDRMSPLQRTGTKTGR